MEMIITLDNGAPLTYDTNEIEAKIVLDCFRIGRTIEITRTIGTNKISTVLNPNKVMYIQIKY